MPYTAQKPADAGKLIALYLREVIFVSSWGILGGALLLPFTLYWYYGIPPPYSSPSISSPPWKPPTGQVRWWPWN